MVELAIAEAQNTVSRKSPLYGRTSSSCFRVGSWAQLFRNRAADAAPSPIRAKLHRFIQKPFPGKCAQTNCSPWVSVRFPDVTVAGLGSPICGSDKPAWSASSRAGPPRLWVHQLPSSIRAGRVARAHVPSLPAYLSLSAHSVLILVSILPTERGGKFPGKESPLV